MAQIQLIQQTIASRQHEDAFYIVDVEDIIQKHQLWLSKMPRIKPFYAVKCNDTPIVLEILAALGIGFDCASRVEIETVLSIGVSPTDIIYANPCKMQSHIEYAIRRDVDLMTFDNEEELIKIAECAPTARLVMRIKVDDSHSKYHLGRKFGTSSDRVPHLLELAKRLELNIVGVSFHVGSECGSYEPYITAISDAAQVFKMATEAGFQMNILDIGGGFPGNSGEKNKILFEQIANTVNNSIDTYFPPETNLQVIAEPGRFYVASAFTLSSLVIGKRKDTVDNKVLMMYYVTDGLWGSFANVRVGTDKMVPIPLITEKRAIYNSLLWGQTCEDFDCFRHQIVLPEINIGEWLIFEDMGAYTVVLYSNYNGFQVPSLKYFMSEKAADYLRQLPNWHRIVKTLCRNDSLNANYSIDTFNGAIEKQQLE